jgi:hypothetical protein
MSKPFNPVLCPVCVENNLKSRLYLKGTHVTYKGIKSRYDQDGIIQGFTDNDKPTTHEHDIMNENGEWCCTHSHKGTYIKYEKCKVTGCEFGIGPRVKFTIHLN